MNTNIIIVHKIIRRMIVMQLCIIFCMHNQIL